MTTRRKKYIHEGPYVAEVEVDLIESETGWGPYISVDDATKLDDIREALRAGNLQRASRLARIFTLTPLSA